MTGLEKSDKNRFSSVPFSGWLISDFDFGQALAGGSAFSDSVSLGFQKKALVERIGFDCLALFPDRPTVMEI